VNAVGVIAASLLAAASLDPTFDGDGKVLTDFGGRDSAAHAVAVQPDGKIVAAGEAGGDFALARYNADGSVDFTTTTDFGGPDRGFAVVVQADGRIVVAGSAGNDFALARYNPDGSLDRKVVTDLGGDDGISRVLPAPRGRLVAVGVSGDRVALVWYRPDWSVERRVFGPLGSPGLGAAAAPGGKIVVAAPRVVNPRTPNPRIEYRLLRFRPDGRLDRTFGGDGLVVRRAPPHWTGGSAVAVRRDGGIVLVGHGHGRRAGFAIVRFRPDGRFEGASVGEVGFGARAVTLDRSGRIVVTGAAYDLNDFVVARFTARGRLDRSFGAPTTDLGAAEAMWALAIQPDGRVVVAGQSGKTLALARFRG
jgi:uncharacterized delta-60 repeat protein